MDRGEEEKRREPAARSGVARIAIVAAGLAVLAAVPYLVPGLERFRVWRSGDPLPLQNVFDFEPPRSRAPIAGASRRVWSQGYDPFESAPLPGEAGARPGGRDSEKDEVAPEEEVTPAADAGRAAVDAGAAEAGERELPLPPPLPDEALGGVAREIEDPSGSMEHFYESLARVALERPGAVSRILFYSVSTNGSDRVSGALRAGLQERFGDAGKGFVPMAPGWSSQEHRDLDWKHRHYVTRVVNRGKEPSGRYGLAGVLAVSRGPLAESSFGTEDSGPSNREVSRFDLFYQAWPEGPEVELRVDDRSPELISTAAPEPVDRLHRIEAPRGPHELTVGAEGQGARFYGVAMENDGPGVVVDALMLIGNSVEMLPHWSYEHLQKQVELRAPDLVVLWLGGNDVRARRFTHEWFVRHYGEFIENLRAGRPEASCLVLSTLDKGLMRNGRVVSRRRVQRVRDAQLATASEQGCAFFDLYEATGGFGTVERWYNARPRLMVDDLNHLTFTGARVVGSVMEKALLSGYDSYFDRLRSRPGG